MCHDDELDSGHDSHGGCNCKLCRDSYSHSHNNPNFSWVACDLAEKRRLEKQKKKKE